jgi:mono/diheme cytochrome c family protein
MTPPPPPAETPVAGEKIAGQAVVLFSTPTEVPVVEEKTVETAATSPTSAGAPLAGEKIFVSACAACHGQDMAQNEFIATKTDRERCI